MLLVAIKIRIFFMRKRHNPSDISTNTYGQLGISRHALILSFTSMLPTDTTLLFYILHSVALTATIIKNSTTITHIIGIGTILTTENKANQHTLSRFAMDVIPDEMGRHVCWRA